MPKAITVRLVGGLGNQLFGYYAGAALAARHEVPLRLDTSWTRHGMTDHGIEILEFNLPGLWLKGDSWKTRLSAPGTIPARAAARVIREVPILGRPFRIHEASSVGEDPGLFHQPPGTRLRGYFQSWRVVEYAVNMGIPRRPQLKRFSPWLHTMHKRALDEKPIVVHVRRGDYLTIDDFAFLDSSYYEPAISLLRGQKFAGPIWLFSDEPGRALKALGRYASEAEVVTSPEGPASELLVMSHGAAHVIANSTFSWWGAWMNSGDPPVVTPATWFSDGRSVEGLIPPSWKSLDPRSTQE